MKKLITIIALALCVAGVSAQQGSFYLGTSGINPFSSATEDFSPMTGVTIYNDGDDNKTTTFGLAPEVGYFISDNFAVGLGVFFNYSQESFDADGVDDLKYTTFGVNPYARYYFLNKGDFRMYGQLNIEFASTKEKEDDDAMMGFGVNVVPGISYNLADNFAINATFGELGYSQAKIDGEGPSEFGLKVDMSTLKFGFTVSF